MNKILATLLFALSIALMGCAQLGEKAVDPTYQEQKSEGVIP